MNYVLPIIGAYLVINGIMVDSQASTIMQQTAGILYAGFGLLTIGIGALIGTVKIGFARLEKRLTPAPVAATVSAPAPEPEQPSPSPKESESYWNRVGLMRPWTAE